MAGNFSFSIDKFNEVIGERGGFQAPNRYSVYISHPTGLKDSYNAKEAIPYLAEALSFPGRSIATADYKTYGPVTKIGRESVYADLSITFMLTEDMSMRHYFDSWMNIVQNDRSYDPNYLDDYAGDIYIGQLGVNQDAILCAPGADFKKFKYAQKIEDAFPTSVGDVSLSFAENNTYGKLQVNFTYRRSINLQQKDQ